MCTKRTATVELRRKKIIKCRLKLMIINTVLQMNDFTADARSNKSEK